MPQQGTGTHKFRDGTYTGEWCGVSRWDLHGRVVRHGQGIMAYNSGDRCVRHAGGFYIASIAALWDVCRNWST